MHTWGAGSFENEAATAFGREVVEDGVYALQEAFAVALDPDMQYLELEDGQRAVCAAEILRAVLSGHAASLPEAELRAWAEAQAPAELTPLRDLAREALERVVGPDSELPDYFEASPHAADWRRHLQELRAGIG